MQNIDSGRNRTNMGDGQNRDGQGMSGNASEMASTAQEKINEGASAAQEKFGAGAEAVRENAAKKVAAARKKLEAAEREYKQARLALERSESMFTKVITYLTHHAR